MDNRDMILSTSLDLFSLHGYDAVGVQEICDSSAVTKPTLYHYFGSKQGLLAALMEARLSPYVEGLERDCEYDRDLSSNLLSSCRRTFELAKKEAALLRLLLGSFYSPPESDLYRVASPWNARIQWTLERLFSSAERDHGNMAGRSSLHATSFLGTIFAYAGLALSGKVKTDEALARLVVRTFMHGIFS